MCTLSHDELAEVQVMVRPRSQLALPSDPMALASRRFFRQRTWRVPGCISKAMPLPPTSCQRLRRACHLNRRCRPRATAAMSNGTAPAIQKVTRAGDGAGRHPIPFRCCRGAPADCCGCSYSRSYLQLVGGGICCLPPRQESRRPPGGAAASGRRDLLQACFPPRRPAISRFAAPLTSQRSFKRGPLQEYVVQNTTSSL